jgi:hypothetical protein
MIPKVAPGQPADKSAETWNAFVDAANAHKRSNRTGGGPGGAGFLNSDIVLVKNDSGEDLDRYSAVIIREPIVLPADNEIDFKLNLIFKVEIATADDIKAGLPFLILAEPIPDGLFGQAVIAGATQCWIYLQNEADTHIDISPDDQIPISGNAGQAKIIWVAGGVGTADETGEQFAIVQMGVNEAPFLRITSSSGGTNGIWEYSVVVYLAPDPDAIQVLNSAKALNLWETDNTTTNQSGYAIASGTCGDVESIKAIPSYAGWFKSLGRIYKDGEWKYLFSERNEPNIYIDP